eukprot:TRINITY_DN2289_c0_g2_i3.p1 TRINITY_DN2289_c0_g2~~TRINITY_DN2289_c0_g2_i3.p1  ORF type:complete len:534 (+),score=69.84 TRINITY_DN2289_c0_g2_i3:132-1733(+)
MMRLQTYAGFSLLGAITVIYHAFNSRGQFYPATVYLSTSKISLVILMNMGLVCVCFLWQLIKHLFLGTLREAEIERLNEQSWREAMEILFAITIFRQDLSVSFLAMVAALLMIKALHWLAQKRVEYIEITPSITMLSHARIVSFMGFLLVLDCLFLHSSLKYLIQTQKASVSIFFAFEYMILATTTVATFVKYVFYVSDMLMEGQWERKAIYTFYVELVRDLLHLSLYLIFFLLIFVNYGAPLHLIRELYETFRNFKARVADYVRYRKITSNMNDHFPDATAEELNVSDATCIICREEMITGKKLLCGHIFHIHCLRSWLERQHTCPTCRSLVVPPENQTTASGAQHRVQSDGSGMTGTPVQGSGDCAAGDNLSPHQARLQAASAAAAIYAKSYVYPSANTFAWSPGYALQPQIPMPTTEVCGGEITESTGETSTSGQMHQHQSPIPSGYPDLVFPQVLHCAFIPLQVPNASITHGRRLGTETNVLDSQLEAQEKFLRHQIEVLRNQVQLIWRQKLEESKAVTGDTIPDTSDR